VRPTARILAAGLMWSAATLALGGDVVVLKGGTVIALKQPVVRRGSTAYLTRADGTLLSVPVSEIDRDATAAANHTPAPPAPKEAAAASTPADAARTGKDGQKARVRITDADVSHPLDLSSTGAEDKDKKKDETAGGPRVEVADYTRQKNGGTLLVKGTLRNPGQGPAENVRMTVSAMDEKGQPLEGANATLSKGTVDSGGTVEFTASLNVGEKSVSTLHFQPQWTVPPPPAPAQAGGRPGAAAGQAQAGGGANGAPAPQPTPYGRGNLYAAPVASASTDTPSDSHTGYLPSVSHPDNQPKPPNR